MTTRGRVQRVSGGLLVALGTASAVAIAVMDPEPPELALAVMAIALATLASGVVLLQRGRKLGQPTALEQRVADSRAPAVYLRAFSSDSRAAMVDVFQT
jgi:hypothetical protein